MFTRICQMIIEFSFQATQGAVKSTHKMVIPHTFPDVLFALVLPGLSRFKCRLADFFVLIIFAIVFCLQNGMADEFSNTSNITSAFEMQGESVCRSMDQSGNWKVVDTNRFTVIVAGCSWKITLVPSHTPNQPTIVSDDGTNCYIWSRGSGSKGTTLISNKLVEYFDSATIMASGSFHPRHHSVAIWLLFCSGCVITSQRGYVHDVLQLNPDSGRLRLQYDRVIDKNKNSLGLADARFYLTSKKDNDGLELVGDIHVTTSRQVDGVVLPRSVELRRYVSSPVVNQNKTLVQGLYSLEIQSYKRVESDVLVRPAMSIATSVVDRRVGANVEYVGVDWKTIDEVQALMKGDALRYHAPRETDMPNSGRRLFTLSCLAAVSLSGGILIWKFSSSKRNNNKVR